MPVKPPVKKTIRKPITPQPRLGSRKSLGDPTVKAVKDVPEEMEDLPYSIPKITAAVIIAILILFLIVYAVWPKGTNCGFDKACFIEKANQCKKATVRNTIGDNSIIKYTTEDCILTKEIDKFSETEPEDVITFFKNKKMTCPYIENNFNTLLIEGLSTGMDDCEGELKQAILKLQLAELALE
ncbi:hypothetical protein KY332_03115 [Candidatus Woesearchaeota archaeon]|nr:hypothetical protein [Candidatus Woesearchaeota archaeon]